MDPGAIRFSREVERCARALVDAERRVGEAPPEPAEERLERVERELARVRRELSSPPATETVMAEVAG